SRALNDGRSLLLGSEFLCLFATVVDPTKLFLVPVSDCYAEVVVFSNSFCRFDRALLWHQCSGRSLVCTVPNLRTLKHLCFSLRITQNVLIFFLRVNSDEREISNSSSWL